MDEEGRQVRDAVLETTEAVLEAQLRAVRALRRGEPSAKRSGEPRVRGRSQVDMAFDILHSSGPLHVKVLIERIAERFGTQVDRESLVSALSKRVAREDRFCRVGRNVFDVIQGTAPKEKK
jgi:hypothetical protein